MSTADTAAPIEFERHVEELEERGYTIIEHAIPGEIVEGLLADVDRLNTALDAKTRTDRFGGFKTIKVQNLVGRSDLFRRQVVDPAIRRIIEHAIGPGYLLTSSMTLDMQPGEDCQPLHTDDIIYSETLPRPRPPLVCNTIWALTDFTAENGATRVIPYSHKSALDPGRTLEEVLARADEPPPPELGAPVPAEMPAGSILVLHGSLWHGGGANRTSQRRIGIAADHCAGWLRPTSNNMFSMPLDQIRCCDPVLQEMLGFGVYRGIIGRIDARSPVEVLGLHSVG